MKTMKKLIVLVMVAVMTLSLAACGGKGGNNEKVSATNGGKPVEIRYWNSGMGTAFLDAAIEAFNEKQSDWFVYYTASSDSQATKSAFGMGDVDTIDLYMTTKVVETNKMVPLNDVLDTTIEGESKSIKEKFATSYLEYEESTDGNYYTLTWGGGVIGIVYNTTLFEKAGITEIPRTTNELAVACDKLYESNITPFTHFRSEEGVGYWSYMQELWFEQYDGWDYYKDTFYGCTDATGNSPSQDVLLAQDGRYQVLKAMEKFITPEYVQNGANSQDHITAQTLFLTNDIAMMVSGSWMANEMKGTQNASDFGVMKTPVISGITDKLTTVKGDTELRNLISAIDEVTDGKAELSKYQSGDGYLVNGKQVSAADWEYVANARNSVAVNYPQHSCFIPTYSDAIEGSKAFLKFFYSDECYKLYTDALHCIIPLNLSEGELDTEGWSRFEKDMFNLFQKSTYGVNSNMATKHRIFTAGGAHAFANYNFVEYFCANNSADRVTAEEAWNKITQLIKTNYKAWYANIQ